MLIAGGGIAGLAMALALARQGVRSTVLEQGSDFREVGAGVQLGPNALRALDTLGLRDKIDAVVSWPEAIVARDAMSGQTLSRLNLDAAFRTRYRESYAAIHRADLLALLLAACREYPELISLRNNVRVEQCTSDAAGVQVLDGDARLHHASALIGADGLWSRVRHYVLADGPPRFSGDVALRALVPNTSQTQEVSLWLGPDLHVVAYPVRKGAFLNIVAICACPEGGDLRGWEEAAPPHLLHRFAGHHPLLDALLAQPSAWSAWPLLDRNPVLSWSRGRVCLIGDAAHPSLQYMAQGACLALEDAVCLAGLLSGLAPDADPAAAFSAFSLKRHARAARMVQTTRRLGQIYHARGLVRIARNAAMRMLPEARAREMMAWVYDY